MHNTCLNQLCNDLAEAARLAEVPFNSAITQRVLSVFADGFRCAPIEMRTTDKPANLRGLSYRFVELDAPMDPFRVGRESGLLPQSHRPVDRLVPEIRERFSIQGWGVDAEVAYGVEKMWPFLTHAYPLSELGTLTCLPAAVGPSLQRIQKHGLTHFSIVAADYRHESVNVYLMASPTAPFSVSLIDALLEEFGLVGSSELVAYAASGVALNFTFSYASPDLERLCVYVPAPQPELVPANLHPNLHQMVAKAPLTVPSRAFIVGPTFGRKGMYTKLELDYTGTTLGALMRCAQVRPFPG